MRTAYHMMTRNDEFALFVAVLAETDEVPSPQSALALARKLRREARTIEAINVRECNGQSRDGDDRRRVQAVNRARAALPSAWPLRLGGDPQGFALKIGLPTGRYNTWGGEGEGWGVPT